MNLYIRCLIFVSFITFLLLFSTPGFTQPKNNDFVNHRAERTIDVIASGFMSDTIHVSLSIGIYNKGKTQTYFYGSKFKNKKELPNAATIYELASLTKSFTGILLAQAVLDKKITLLDPVTKYLGPEFENLSFQNKAVRIIDLANHTSGLPKNIPDYPVKLSPEEILDLSEDFSEKKFLDKLAKIDIKQIPGSAFHYSNAGTQLIGIILEKVYGQSYDYLVKRFITDPNGMHDTKTTITAADFAPGHDASGNVVPLLDQWKTVPAAANLKSNIKDMLQYVRLNLQEDNNETIRLAHIPTYFNTDEDDADIGLFWFVKKPKDKPREVMHAGGSFGTTGYCLLIPQLQIGIVCFANDAGLQTEKELKQLAHEILSGL